MQIKNIRQFRSNWRNEQGYKMSNWDENFIGANHGEKSGFYKMVNGIVENIKADLTPKLQNAQDEQAIYEFLQNAADSRSTECAVIYDEQYFMVLNNGAPFTEKDLKALLNSFQGTKADKNKAENCDKIGRYGIGFKLAYRLIGKLDGAEELLRDLAGPLLFSWHNPQQFNDLLQHQEGSKLQLNSNIEGAEAPWLLKIILACFPCAPNEEVLDLDYKGNVLFQEQELMELLRFLKKNETLLRSLSLQQGSLFFLKFGPKKHEKLRDSLLNIQSGIGYSMNTLKTLQRVVLQDKTVERYPVDVEQFSVLPGSDDFKRIDPEFPNCPISISLGFPKTTEQSVAMKNAPSLYQFFPMRNERHGMAFFIHSTSFAKITDRTRLDDQGEANIETFKYLAAALKKNLNKYKIDDFDRYALIYKALLLTDRSKEYDSALLNTHLYDPMLQYIQAHIPTRKRNTFPKDLVVIKRTNLPVEPMSFGIGKEWLYWVDAEKDDAVLRDAANSAKLGLKAWTLRDLLLEGNPSLINSWIEDLDEADYQQFIAELKQVAMDNTLLQKFKEIKCFKFTDNRGNRCFYAIDDLRQADNLFLINERTAAIRAEVKALGFSVLEFDIMDYSGILQQLESQLDYLSNEKALAAKIASRTASASLTPAQKMSIFLFLKDLKGMTTDDLRQVVLFNNRKGNPCKLQSLLNAEVEAPAWLDSFRIAEYEDNSELQDFLVAKVNLWEAYTHIVLPKWAEISQESSIRQDADSVKAFYQKVLELSALRSAQPKLTATACIYTDAENGFLPVQQVFYHKALAQVNNYSALRMALQKTMGMPIPAQEVLAFLPNDPFKLPETTNEKDWKNRQTEWLQRCQTENLTASEKQALFALIRQMYQPKDWTNIKLFNNKKNQREPLSRLLSNALTTEPWLEDYKIKSDEQSDDLQAVLCQEADIFANILAADWQNVTQHLSVRKDITAFYQSAIKYANLSKAAKPLTNLRYIYVNEDVGFVSASECFFHNALAELDDYKNFRTAVRTLTNLYTPHPAVLPFLKDSVIFKTKEALLGRALANDNVLLSREELTVLQHFMNQTPDDFFMLLCVEEQSGNAREFAVTRRTNRVSPIYLDKSQQKVADQIRQLYAEQYKILPHKLYFAELRNKGLMTAAQLFEQLSKSKDAPADLMSAMLAESGNNELQQQVFSKIEKIVLRQGVSYPKETFEHQALQLFRNKDADYNSVRAKIWIETTDGKLLRLSEIAFEPTLTFSIERFGKYTLQLADVLPRFRDLQALCEQVFNQIQDYEAPTALKRRCFESLENPAKDVFAELRRDYKLLNNASQLAFALLFAKEAGNEKLLREFNVVSANNQTPVSLAQYEVFHLNALPFIELNAVLDKNTYSGIEDLLKLNDKRFALEFGAQRLVTEPYFDKNTFYCTPVRALQPEEQAAALQLELLEYAFQKWQALEAANRPAKFNFYANADGTLLGLDLEALVYPNNFALDEEQLPEWLAKWLGNAENEEHGKYITTAENNANGASVDVLAPAQVWVPSGKLGFLYALGVNTSKSEVVTLRRYLHKNEGEATSQRQLNDLRGKDKQFLEKTVFWLKQKKTRFSDDERVVWLRKLYNTIEQLPAHFPLPYISEVKGSDERFVYQLEYNDEGDLYLLDNRQQTALRDKYGVTAKMLLDAVTVSGNRITNLEIKGVEPKTSRIEEELNVEALQQDSQEWGATHYLKWRAEVPYTVYLYPRQMPYRLRFLDATIKNFERDNAVLCDSVAYICRQVPNVEEELFGIAKSATLSEQLLLQLLRYKNENTKESGHKVIEKIVEKVVVEDNLAADEELIESPSLEQVKSFKKQPKSRLKLTFDLDNLPEELLEQVLAHAQKSKAIVKKTIDVSK